MTDQPPTADAATLKTARARVGALLTAAGPRTDLDAQPGTSAHGVLAAHRDREDARAAAAHYAAVMRLVRAALLHTTKEANQ